LLATCCAIAFALAAVPALAQSDTAATGDEMAEVEDTLLATVNGEEIRQSDVLRLAESLPPAYRQQLAQIFPMLVERMIDMHLLAAAGRADGLAETEEVKELVAEAETNAIRQVYLERAVEAAITEEALAGAYEGYLAENPPETEVHARHILVETEDEAKAIIAELQEGGDFSALAIEHSTGPSGASGGDLGYFKQGAMVAPFADAAFALEPGSFTETPVETQFGWHVILVEDRRDTAPPSLAEVEPQLRDEISRQAIEARLASLRAEAEITMMVPGEPEGEASGEPEQEPAEGTSGQ
jgi:peptidyl-prolyl cis-trans isomerase C